MLRGGLLTAVGSAGWSGVVVFGWPWISAGLYRGQYQDIGDMAWLWGGNVVLGSIAVALSTAMLVQRQFRELALIDLGGAVVCAGSTLMLLSWFDYSTSIIGTMAGQATQILLMVVVIIRSDATSAGGFKALSVV